ncbi:hypothetical protein V6Z05_06140 [Leptospira venezuelensis]|uniref:hypothetical protein n=1 Tax=Leptospira venezuelensis TaxID=1958811 RepID=UPI0012FFC648|nr:hypothetical protein [Leptospira venezuelensis]
MKQYVKNNIMRFILFIMLMMSYMNCSSKISLWRERIPQNESQQERGNLEISLDNSKNKKIETIYIQWFIIRGQEIKEKFETTPRYLQIHSGELYANTPYAIEIPPGESLVELHSAVLPFRNTDLEFPFQAYFGYYYELENYSTKLIVSDYREPFCSTISQSNIYTSERRCQKIIIKKDSKTKIIIHAQPDGPIKTELGMKVRAAGRIPLIIPQAIKTRETPEVLIEVQNPK